MSDDAPALEALADGSGFRVRVRRGKARNRYPCPLDRRDLRRGVWGRAGRARCGTRVASDLTEAAAAEGWLYLAPMLALHSRRVVGWAASANNDTELALDALRKALRSRKPLPRAPPPHGPRQSVRQRRLPR